MICRIELTEYNLPAGRQGVRRNESRMLAILPASKKIKMKYFYSLIIVLVSVLSAEAQHTGMNEMNMRKPFMTRTGGRVVYHLYVTDTVVNYTGKKAAAVAINGSIPAPELHFTEGDTAEIHVHNLMHMETSIHWHGLILPNDQDGVPYLTTKPIKGHSTFVYKFPIVQNGTYWYHSHSMLQEQSGMYGAFIIHKKILRRRKNTRSC